MFDATYDPERLRETIQQFRTRAKCDDPALRNHFLTLAAKYEQRLARSLTLPAIRDGRDEDNDTPKHQ